MGARRLGDGEEVVADPLKAIKGQRGLRLPCRTTSISIWSWSPELGRLGLTTSQVTAGIAVENSPEIYCGELTDAVESSRLT